MLLIAYGCGVLLPFMAAGALRVPSRARLIRRAGRWAPRVAATIVVLVGTLELTGVYESVIQRLPMGT
jgi:cytochrome c biogenesis protein CcdA